MERIEPALNLVSRIDDVGPEEMEGSGDHRVWFGRLKLVSGNVIADESIIGFVVVEGLDDVISVTP